MSSSYEGSSIYSASTGPLSIGPATTLRTVDAAAAATARANHNQNHSSQHQQPQPSSQSARHVTFAYQQPTTTDGASKPANTTSRREKNVPPLPSALAASPPPITPTRAMLFTNPDDDDDDDDNDAASLSKDASRRLEDDHHNDNDDASRRARESSRTTVSGFFSSTISGIVGAAKSLGSRWFGSRGSGDAQSQQQTSNNQNERAGAKIRRTGLRRQRSSDDVMICSITDGAAVPAATSSAAAAGRTPSSTSARPPAAQQRNNFALTTQTSWDVPPTMLVSSSYDAEAAPSSAAAAGASDFAQQQNNAATSSTTAPRLCGAASSATTNQQVPHYQIIAARDEARSKALGMLMMSGSFDLEESLKQAGVVPAQFPPHYLSASRGCSSRREDDRDDAAIFKKQQQQQRGFIQSFNNVYRPQQQEDQQGDCRIPTGKQQLNSSNRNMTNALVALSGSLLQIAAARVARSQADSARLSLDHILRVCVRRIIADVVDKEVLEANNVVTFKQKMLKGGHVIPFRSIPRRAAFPAQESIRDFIVRQGSDTRNVKQVLGYDLTVRDFKSVLPSAWLTDNIVNAYIGLAVSAPFRSHRRMNLRGRDDAVVLLNSHFFARLAKEGIAQAQRWVADVDIFAARTVILPINQNNAHWVLAIVDVSERRFCFFDSLGSAGTGFVDKVVQFFSHVYHERLSARRENARKRILGASDYVDVDELVRMPESKKTRRQRMLFVTPLPPTDPAEWKVYTPRKTSPQQNNSVDCGVFACQTAVNVTWGVPVWDLSQERIKFFRELMGLELLNGTLLPRC